MVSNIVLDFFTWTDDSQFDDCAYFINHNAITTYFFDKSLGPIPPSVYGKKYTKTEDPRVSKLCFCDPKRPKNIVLSLSISISVMVCLLKCLSSNDAIIVKNPPVSESREWVELTWCAFVSKKKGRFFGLSGPGAWIGPQATGFPKKG